jgi:hypothetical protein
LDRLAALLDSQIDNCDIPEITDPSRIVRRQAERRELELRLRAGHNPRCPSF